MIKTLRQIFSKAVQAFHVWRSRPGLDKAVNDLSKQIAGIKELYEDAHFGQIGYQAVRNSIIKIESENISWLTIAQAISKVCKKNNGARAVSKNANIITGVVEEYEENLGQAEVEINDKHVTPAEFVNAFKTFGTQHGFCYHMYRGRPLGGMADLTVRSPV